jgi:hypothetical protein
MSDQVHFASYQVTEISTTNEATYYSRVTHFVRVP